MIRADSTPSSGITLSICTRCRDGRERDAEDVRGGARLARALAAESGASLPHRLRGVACMSQCKRPCTVAVSAAGRFTYLFGDLDPTRDASAVLAFLPLYAAAPEGFVARADRPEVLRAGILGRIPPLETASLLVTPLALDPSHVPETIP